MEDAANHLDSSLSQSQLDDFNLELDLTRARASLAEQELRDFEQRLNDVDDSAEDSSDSLNDVGDAADGMDDGFSLADGVISNFVGGAMTKLLDIALQAAEAIWNLDEATEEYRESMALLNTAFETAGFTSDTARQAYEGFYTILGDTGKPQRRPSFCPSLPQALRTWQSGSTLPQASMAPLENPSQLNR